MMSDAGREKWGELLREKQVSAWTGLQGESLRMLRRRGQGPKHFSIGRAVYYHRDDVAAWIAEQRAKAGAA